MSGYRFGDVLRYPDDQGVGDDILFMYVCPEPQHSGPITVMVLRTTPDDDVWEPGYLTTAGAEELIPVPAIVKTETYGMGQVIQTYGYLNLAGLRDE